MMLRLIRMTFLMAIAASLAAPAFAHCDAVDGPVVMDAKAAIAAGNVEPVLKWIAPKDEDAIRAAFERTMMVRGDSEAARALADTWFFETLVRIHREAEGAPYTGLRPAGYDPGVALRRGDEALVAGSAEDLEAMIVEEVRRGIRSRFAAASEAREHREHNVEAGRRFVESYVEFMHYVDRLHRDATTNAIDHEMTAEAAHDH